MKFVQRTHYCPKCEKNVYFWSRTRVETIDKEYNCSRCQTKVISYWEELNNKHIVPYLVGTPFFGASVIYGLWTSLIGPIRGVDILIMILNIVAAAVIVIVGMRNKHKPEIPKTSQKTTEELRIRRVQIWWILIFTLLGYILALIFDVILYFSWIGIEALVT